MSIDETIVRLIDGKRVDSVDAGYHLVLNDPESLVPAGSLKGTQPTTKSAKINLDWLFVSPANQKVTDLFNVKGTYSGTWSFSAN